MPRPPAKRARRAPKKPGLEAAPTHPIRHAPRNLSKKNEAMGASFRVLEESQSDNVYMSGALHEKDTESTQEILIDQIPTFVESRARLNETPRTNRLSYEIGSSMLPRTASKPVTRGQPFASALRRAGGDMSSRFQKISTPAFDGSMLSSFRPRPRQPSILHLMDEDGDDGSSDLDSEAFLGSFDPDDESTPLNLRGRKTMPLDVMPPTPSPKKIVHTMPSGKKRKLIAVEIPLLKPADVYNKTLSLEMVIAEPEADDTAPENSDDDWIPLPEPPGKGMSPGIGNGTMASPMSSSVVGSPVKVTANTPLSKRSNQESKKPLQISTATLRGNLLPARRRRRRQAQPVYAKDNGFDVPSDDDDDDDEVIVEADDTGPTRASSRKSQGGSGAALKLNKQCLNKKIGRITAPTEKSRGEERGGARGTKKKTAVASTAKAKTSKAKDRRKYSGRDSQGKENEVYDSLEQTSVDSDLDGAPSWGASQLATSNELLRQAKKFAEIDRWTMEFEELTDPLSSPFR